MAHDDLEFTRAPRENLRTYEQVKRTIAMAVVAVVILLLMMAAFLV
ncbi:hypothetical protein KAJ83_03855 [Marivibrio halodurans]|uniref:Aa3-type cytochrome c oxidase subunit IV n=1 Tax=Marivibrio halodurans TaxID=2039722 RepID=A0A8J7RX33_9PROT|nr:hypothetical protein [Marivibrio halodurans]MBP5856130.1 hypothetical protein [Marivibrio halodurans]